MAPLHEKIGAVPEYMAELVRKSLQDIGVKDALVINTWQQKSEKLEPDAFYEAAYHELRADYPNIDLTPLSNYVEATKISTMDTQVAPEYEIGGEIVTALLPSLEKAKVEGHNLVTLSTALKLSYEQTKRALREILPGFFNLSTNVNPNEILLPFIISRESCLEGMVISNFDGAKKSVTLLTAYCVNGEFIYQFFGEPKHPKVRQPFIRYNSLFFVYKFQTETKEEIFLLSQKELEMSSCKIFGMEATTYDFLKIGNMAKINTTQKIFFVHSQKPAIDRIDEKKFWDYARNFATKDEMKKAFFGEYPHPDWFAAFIISWALSGKLDNMPTHLSLLSPPGQGKTRMLKNFGSVFEQTIREGGTIKGLVPSFANGVPKEGYLIGCKRFGLVDEFIHVIQSSSRDNGDFDGGSFHLLKVLEHAEGEFSSAFGMIKAKPNMWVFFSSNVRPSEHIKNLVDFHEKLNAAFMSRILWYIYDDEHLAFIKQQKSRVMLLKDGAPKPNKKIVSMVDFLHAYLIDIPLPVVEGIFEKHRKLVPSSLEGDIYDSRMVMHIYRMLDGYSKYKSIIEQRGRFICTPEDIAELDAMMERIIKSWSIGIDENELTPWMKIAYLNGAQREIFEFIKLNKTGSLDGGVDEETLRRLKGNTAIEIAEGLVRKGILKIVLGGCRIFYPYDTV